MIRHQQGLAQYGLAVAPGDFREEVGPRIFDQIAHSFQIPLELFDAFAPRLTTMRRLGLRPISLRPRRRLVLRVAAELENIPQSDAQVFEEHPGRVRKILRLGAAQLCRKVFDRVVEFDVSVATGEKVEKMLPQRLVVGHWSPPLALDCRRRQRMRSLPLKSPRLAKAPRHVAPAFSDHYWCGVYAAGVGVRWSPALPIASPDRISSTRRFCWRPSAVSLVAMGSVLPKPRASTDAAATPCCTK